MLPFWVHLFRTFFTFAQDRQDLKEYNAAYNIRKRWKIILYIRTIAYVLLALAPKACCLTGSRLKGMLSHWQSPQRHVVFLAVASKACCLLGSRLKGMLTSWRSPQRHVALSAVASKDMSLYRQSTQGNHLNGRRPKGSHRIPACSILHVHVTAK